MRLLSLFTAALRLTIALVGIADLCMAQGNINEASWLAGKWGGDPGDWPNLVITLTVRPDGTYTYRMSGDCELAHDGNVIARDAGTEQGIGVRRKVAEVDFKPTRILKAASSQCSEHLRKRRVLANSEATFRVRHDGNAIQISVIKDDIYYWRLEAQ
jgi:hypothetical protein